MQGVRSQAVVLSRIVREGAHGTGDIWRSLEGNEGVRPTDILRKAVSR